MIRWTWTLLAACVLGIGCASTPPPAPAEPAPSSASTSGAPATAAASGKSLYDRLGGLPAIGAVVDEFLKNVAGDTRIAHRFALTDLKDLRNKLVDQICQATGGPCTYKGGDMKTVHKGQRVSSADFNALVEDLVKALDTFKVPEKEKTELLNALASMQGDIVEVP
jgi:hemoglobin